MLFPTLVVFLCMLPALLYIQTGAINAGTLIGFVVCLLATTLQLFADAQLHRFQHNARGRSGIIRSGLWKHSRHPNYLGEILMWWGVWIVFVSVNPGLWYLCAGAVVNTLMFLLFSIPIADRRLSEYKSGFSEYKKQTNMLLPFAFRRG
jgi:steroid 5-alpha reductase family enzyme